MKRNITRKIAELDPERDCQEIVYLLQSYEFPWDYERALEFALFRTYAVPAISRLLAKTVNDSGSVSTPRVTLGPK
jgi:hypothetical protein